MQGRLERDPAGVESDRLADEPELNVGTGRLRRLVAQDDEARRVVARLRDRGERTHALFADLVPPERFRRDRRRLRCDLGRARGQPLGCRLVSRAVDEIPGAVRPLGDPGRALRDRRDRLGPRDD